MKKLLVVVLLFISMLAAKGQGSANTCTAFKELVSLAASDNLYGLAVDSFESRYMKPLYGMELSKSSKNIPGVRESFVTLDRSTGATYNAYLNDYGKDGAAAIKDFKKIVATYSACVPDGVLTNADEETAYIRLPKSKIKLHVYECSWTNTWTTYITIQHL